ncbi:MAG: cyclodeaminase [Pseudomonadota bacterium]
MPSIKVLNETNLRDCISLDLDTVECIEKCFQTLAIEAVIMPPILRLDIHENNGEVDVKTAYLPGLDSFAIKISPGFFDNPKIGLPSTSGMMNLFSAKTGQLEAVLLDNGYLTDVRTAAAGAVAAKHLAREDATKAAIIGAGAQASLQLKALTLVRNIQSAKVWARDAEKARIFADRTSGELGIEVNVASSVADAISDNDIVVTTTPSTSPLVLAEHLTAGQHVTAMGSDAEHKNELHPEVLQKADLYFCDRISQVRVLGELHHAIDAGAFTENDVAAELGQVIAGQHSGRASDAQITLCDLTGTGAQDTAIATLARLRAEAAGMGLVVES